ncbi:putative Ig domain-containing protein [Neorhizobium sp. T25_27]|uniref:putative Ig domain-containing protein n=1 Tax=Neorhizobium sp. T25_27 TaxID=2093831 RepID=UPI000CF9E82C|nr:putative Ig domain-containing protein [Neorhizobium sp. T25_27]
MILKAISVASVLLVTDATAGEIIWRSPTSGTLTAVSDPVPPLEPEQPAFEIRYEPIQVGAGTSISVMPIGDISGYTFAARNPLPPGLALDTGTGKIVGLAAVAGVYDIIIRAAKDGSSSDLMLWITIS